MKSFCTRNMNCPECEQYQIDNSTTGNNENKKCVLNLMKMPKVIERDSNNLLDETVKNMAHTIKKYCKSTRCANCIFSYLLYGDRAYSCELHADGGPMGWPLSKEE